MQGKFKILFFLLFCLSIQIRAQIQWSLLDHHPIYFSSIGEYKWWEWKVENKSCDTVIYKVKVLFEDTLGLSFNFFINNDPMNDSTFLLTPMEKRYIKVFVKSHFEKEQNIEVVFSPTQPNLEKKTYALKTFFYAFEVVQPKVFPQISSGLFKIYHPSKSYYEVIVMDRFRNILLHDTHRQRFIDLTEFEQGDYIVQINNQEYSIVKK